MQKASPFVLVLILLVSAVYFSMGAKDRGVDPGRAPEEVVTSVEASPPLEVEDEQESSRSRWPHEDSDIPADPKAVFGHLENGMRYIIYPNQEPPGRVSLRMHIDAGSLMEADDQRGVAHFLEHMVFNGTRHHTADELIPKMQRLGITFGLHANAYTSFDETVYMLDVPDLEEQSLDLCFTVMRDFADGALLDTEEIDKERGVILSEKMSRDSVHYRLMEQKFKRLIPESLISERFPIGISEVISNAPRERFVEFYRQYYTPRRTTFVVVGDVDPAAMQKRIETAFASFEAPEEEGRDPNLGEVNDPDGLKVAVLTDRELSASDVSLTLIRPFAPSLDTVADRTSRLPLELAHTILSRRFKRISEQADSPVAEGYASKDELFQAIEIGSIGVVAAENRWQEVVPILEQEFRRAFEHGFTASEIREAKMNLLNAYQQAVKQEPTRRSEGLATMLVQRINQHRVFSTPERDLAIVAEALDAIDADSCHEAFRAYWRSSGYDLVLTAQELTEEQPEELLKTIYVESKQTAVEAPEAHDAGEFGYLDFGGPGTVKQERVVEDLAIKQLVLANEVRVNLKQTPFEKGKIRVLVRFGSGQLSQPSDSPMLQEFVAVVFNQGGLGKHSDDDLQYLLAGKNVGVSLTVAEDAFLLGGESTPDDMGLQLRLMCAYLTDPGWRDEGLWQFQKAIPMISQQLRHTTAGPEMEMNAWLHGGDPRYAAADADKLASYTLEDAKAWLNPELAEGYLELSIVGDYQETELIPELLASFGALSKRATAPAANEQARKVIFPNAPGAKTFLYESKIEQGIAYSIWKTQGLRGNLKEFRRLNIVADILGDRLRKEIRENLGASYSPGAGPSGSEALEDFGYVLARSVAKPEDVTNILKVMGTIGEEFAQQGADEDEFERAVTPTLIMLEKSLRDNGYWLGTVLSQSQAQPERLELARGRDEDYRSITLKEVNALAKQYLSGANQLQVTIEPES